jgi:hypothetical protein
MKRSILLLIPLLAACGRGEGDDTAGGDTREPVKTAGRDSREPVQTADLTGLYEARREDGRSARMCMTSDQSGTVSFAIVTEAPDGGCGGAGEAVREAGLLRLTMGGDEECVINGRIAGTQVTFPTSLAQGCAYYCAAGASLAGVTLEKTGGTTPDAMRAIDLAGDPLCG